MDIVNMTLNGEKIFALSDALCAALDTFLEANKMTIEEVTVAICHFKNLTTSSDKLPSEIMAAFEGIAKFISQAKPEDVKMAHEAATTSADDFYLDSLPVPIKHLH